MRNFRIILGLAALVAVAILIHRVHAFDDLRRAWPAVVTLGVAMLAVLPESLRERMVGRLGWQVVVTVIVAVLLTTALATPLQTSARQHFDATLFEEVRPRQQVTLTVSGLPSADRLTVELLVTDHDATLGAFCQNEVILETTTGDGTPLTVSGIDGHRHRFVVTPLPDGKDLRLSVSYRTDPARTDCREDIAVDTAVLE